jgi:putative transposase
VSEPIGEIPEKVDYYTQQAALKETKILFPDYKNIWAESQQVNLQRLKKAWERWLIPDKSGKRGGRPRFKKQGELRSFVYPRVNDKKAGANLNNGILKLSKIGEMPVIMHRPLPDGFVLKLARLSTSRTVGIVVSQCRMRQYHRLYRLTRLSLLLLLMLVLRNSSLRRRGKP